MLLQTQDDISTRYDPEYSEAELCHSELAEGSQRQKDISTPLRFAQHDKAPSMKRAIVILQPKLRSECEEI